MQGEERATPYNLFYLSPPRHIDALVGKGSRPVRILMLPVPFQILFAG
jgi:hypothetical protein